jgi:hypothetical protein
MRYETALFQEQLADIRKSDRNAAEQIDAITTRLVTTPELNDGPLKGSRNLQFKKKAVQKRYRIIFRYCQHCVRTKKEKCGDCADREDSAVILEEVFFRRDGYD